MSMKPILLIAVVLIGNARSHAQPVQLGERYAWMEGVLTPAEQQKTIAWIEAHSGPGWPYDQMESK